MERKGFFARLADLWRGFWGVKLSDAEARNAEVVYHNAINEHVRHHDKLKDAISRLVYLRNRIEAELKEKREDLTLVTKALRTAVAESDDERALKLIAKQRTFQGEVTRLEAELSQLTAQCDKAKGGLKEVKEAVRRLKEERGEMLARKAHALARRDAQAALSRLSDTNHVLGSMTALENVRESILRLEQSVDLDEEDLETTSNEISMAKLRAEAQSDADIQALAELKAELGLLVEPTEEHNGGNGKTLGPVLETEQTQAQA